MKFFFTKQSVIALGFLVVLGGSLASPALALITGDPTKELRSVPIIGFEEGAVSASLDVLKGALEGIDPFCKGVDKVSGVLDTVASVTDKFGGLELIGPNPKLVVDLQNKVTRLEGGFGVFGIIPCYEAAQKVIKNDPVISQFAATKRQTALDNIDRNLGTLKLTLNDLKVNLRVAKMGFWKAILMWALMQSSQTLAVKATNALTTKFKINDYAQYANSLAGQIYSGQRILGTTGDKSEQVLLRSLLTNPTVQTTVGGFHPGVAAAARKAAGSFETMDITSPNWYQEAYKQGTCAANPYCVDLVEQDKASGVASLARGDAQSNLMTSKGYKDSWKDCKQNVVEQKRIDDDYNKLLAEYLDRDQLLSDLEQGNASAQDIQKAQQDLDIVANKLDTAPEAYDTKVLKTCGVIASTADAIQGGISGIVKTQIEKLSDFKNSDNMPVFIKAMGGLLSTVINKMVTGDLGDGQLFQEAQNTLVPAIGAVNNTIEQEINGNINGGITNPNSFLSTTPSEASPAGGSSGGPGGNTGGSVNAFLRGVTRVLGAQDVQPETVEGPIMPRGPVNVAPRGNQ